MDTRFLRRVAELACLGFLFGASIFPAAAQEGPKLYVFTSGSLGGFSRSRLSRKLGRGVGLKANVFQSARGRSRIVNSI